MKIFWYCLGELLSLGALGLGLYLFWDAWRMLWNGKRAEGKVIGLSYIDTNAYPQVIFKTHLGKKVVFKSKTGANVGVPKRGNKVTVLYDPARPKNARVYSFFLLWLPPLMFISVSLIFMLVVTTGLLDLLDKR